MRSAVSLPRSEFDLFQKFLVEESGLFFDKDRSESLREALVRRMEKRGYDSYQEYYNLLKFHPEGKLEIRELIDLITVGETYFFRNKTHFETLVKFVLPEIIRRRTRGEGRRKGNKRQEIGNKSACRPSQPSERSSGAKCRPWLKIWSAGCSKGDEPYSIAIAIVELLPDYKDWDVSILGTDINRDALVEAKQAVYEEKDISHLPQGYLDKYFERRGSRYALSDSVKKLVQFEHHNLAKDSFVLEGMRDLDIIFCRNVTIYFDIATTKRVIDGFYDCLNRDGHLFIGHAETLWGLTDKFEPVEFPKTFIYRKMLYPAQGKAAKPFVGVPEIKLEEFTPVKETVLEKEVFPREKEFEAETQTELVEEIEKVPRGGPKAETKLELLYKEALKLFNQKKYEDAVSKFDQITTADESLIPAHFGKATILANQGEYQEAITELNKIIEVDNLYVEAYYLLGVLCCKTGDFKEAETQFRKVIYVDPTLALAYFDLGNIYLYEKKPNEAAREFNNAISLLERKSREEQVELGGDFTVEFLLRACKNNLARIADGRRGREQESQTHLKK